MVMCQDISGVSLEEEAQIVNGEFDHTLLERCSVNAQEPFGQ